ncbi:hypothetical protein NW764_002851 [Fusarium oxysporum]|nr:hypothetical protein NW764_002851 [Fusarium oxysporum]
MSKHFQLTVINMHARFDLGGSGWSLWETWCGANQGLNRCQGDIAFTKKRDLPTKLEFQPSPLQLLQVDSLRKAPKT